MTYSDLLKKVDREAQTTLAPVGFAQRGEGVWKRLDGEHLNLVALQKKSSGQSFCVNLGMHFSFIPKNGSSECPAGDQIEQTECLIMFRLTKSATDKDQWWDFTENAVQEVSHLLRDRVSNLFEQFRLDKLASEIKPSAIEVGNLGVLDDLTKVSACLLLAKIHERLSNTAECIEFALSGLKVAGMAVGPKKVFKDLLKRHNYNL